MQVDLRGTIPFPKGSFGETLITVDIFNELVASATTLKSHDISMESLYLKGRCLNQVEMIHTGRTEMTLW